MVSRQSNQLVVFYRFLLSCWRRPEHIQVFLVGGGSQTDSLFLGGPEKCRAEMRLLLPYLCQIDFECAVLIDLGQIAKNLGNDLVMPSNSSIGLRQGDEWEMAGDCLMRLSLHRAPALEILPWGETVLRDTARLFAVPFRIDCSLMHSMLK